MQLHISLDYKKHKHTHTHNPPSTETDRSRRFTLLLFQAHRCMLNKAFVQKPRSGPEKTPDSGPKLRCRKKTTQKPQTKEIDRYIDTPQHPEQHTPTPTPCACWEEQSSSRLKKRVKSWLAVPSPFASKYTVWRIHHGSILPLSPSYPL